jgi:hypothetical protein
LLRPIRRLPDALGCPLGDVDAARIGLRLIVEIAATLSL